MKTFPLNIVFRPVGIEINNLKVKCCFFMQSCRMQQENEVPARKMVITMYHHSAKFHWAGFNGFRFRF